MLVGLTKRDVTGGLNTYHACCYVSILPEFSSCLSAVCILNNPFLHMSVIKSNFDNLFSVSLFSVIVKVLAGL